MQPGSNSEGRIRTGLNRINSFNSSDLQYHRTRPLARVSSISSSESNSLGRRRREGHQLAEPRYTMTRASRSEGSLINPSETRPDVEELSDTESVDGRRVRPKYTSATGDHMASNRATSVSDRLGDIVWRDRNSAVRDVSADRGNSGVLNLARSSQLRSVSLSSEAGWRRAYEAREHTEISPNGEGSSSHIAPIRNSSRPVPLRKDSDRWDPARRRVNSNSDGRRSAMSWQNQAQNASGYNSDADMVTSPSGVEPLDTLSRRASNSGRGVPHAEVLNPSAGVIRALSRDQSSYSTRNDTSSLPIAPQRHSRRSPTEVVLPRWQPDAEVTFCPICRSQFSFFVRKHHCRKCGRVVCNACSPHRITIPYQFIVQPPTDSVTTVIAGPPTGRPVDPSRTRSSGNYTSLGGGERVRLCNPCVPDPNIAPPQTTSLQPQQQRSSHPISHSRSTSLATPYYTPSQPPIASRSNEPLLNASNFARRPRETGIPGNNLQEPSSLQNEHLLSAASSHGGRSRASTSGSNFGGPTRYTRTSVPSVQSGPHPPYRPLVPRDEASTSRPLPAPPRIAEEDECPVCHRELPSNALPNSGSLREAHINRCIESAFSSSTPPVQSSAPPLRQPEHSSSTTTIPIANTPEARTLAREQAHAAVVLGHSQSPTPVRRTGVFPYKATEKDCIDDAECTICLEEFEVGEEMGRLECFCRFHLRCVRQWFELHYGQCPVHQHDGGY